MFKDVLRVTDIKAHGRPGHACILWMPGFLLEINPEDHSIPCPALPYPVLALQKYRESVQAFYVGLVYFNFGGQQGFKNVPRHQANDKI